MKISSLGCRHGMTKIPEKGKKKSQGKGKRKFHALLSESDVAFDTIEEGYKNDYKGVVGHCTYLLLAFLFFPSALRH